MKTIKLTWKTKKAKIVLVLTRCIASRIAKRTRTNIQ